MPLLAVVIRWVHLLAASAWFGSVLALLFLIRPGPSPGGAARAAGWAAHVHYPSFVIWISLGALVTTGFWNAAHHLGSWSNIVTPYGLVLVLKVVLVLAVLALTGRLSFDVVPRVRDAIAGMDAMTLPADANLPWVLRRLRRYLTALLALGAAIFFCAAALSSL